MFTGIVETLGTLIELKPLAGGHRLRIETALAGELSVGESVAVNGVCLTVILTDSGEMHADVGPETGRVSTLGSLARGETVNLERALALQARIGGHLMLGHVDGVGVVEDVRTEGDAHWLTVRFPPALAPLFIRKGSVTVDGVSLTIAGLGTTQFDVQIIPHTWTHTTLSRRRVGDKVNLECDVVGKYIVRSLDLGTLGPPSGSGETQ